MLRTLVETDDLLINSWLSRKWATFIRVWFVSSIAVTVIAFLLPFIFIYVPFFIYNVVVSVMALIFGGPPKLLATTFSDIFNLALPFGVLGGLFTLVFTVPVMLLKQLSGEFKERK
jgi:hypothetical protein